MRLDLFRKKSVKPEDSSGLQVVPTEATPSSFPEVAQPAGETYPEVVPDKSSDLIPISPSLKRKPLPNKDVSLEIPSSTLPQNVSYIRQHCL